MSYYFIGHPEPENLHRWTFNTSVRSTQAILKALHRAGFRAVVVANSESVSPYLDEIDIAKAGATREDVERICAAADKVRPPGVPSLEKRRRFSID
ncbi:MAG: hypothetical protein A3G75_10300 [Verrucomicrobia bacterium RIFCSPLOWO2_12_FULL_64_8]|nr:MAG: hypothetical protein A3G75_10300 [Verrucomicrobia bacterium RIFCSPLOWO2_12_FULL_64_8]